MPTSLRSYLVGLLIAAGGTTGFAQDRPTGETASVAGSRLMDRDDAVRFPWSITPAAIDEEAVWCGLHGNGPLGTAHKPALCRIDPQSRQITATIPLDDQPRTIVAGGGGVWVVPQSMQAPVVRVDARTFEKSPFPFPAARVLAVGEGSLWVIDCEPVRLGGLVLAYRQSASSLVRLDPQTGKEIARLPLNASQLAIGEGAVWATDRKGSGAQATLYRIDPQTNRVVATIPIERRVVGVVAGEGFVWLLHEDDSFIHKYQDNILTRVDPRSNRVVGPPIPVPGGFNTLAVGRGAVWIANRNPFGSGLFTDPTKSPPRPSGVIRLDPRTGERVGGLVPCPAPGVVAGEHGVWVSGCDPYEPNTPPTVKTRAKDVGFLVQLVP